MKFLPGLVLVLSAACARTTTSLPTGEVRCDLVALDLSTDESAMATFRASNETGSPVLYRGYTEDGPLYQCEVLEGDVWQPSPLGWCGTGLEPQVLEPGERIDFAVVVPKDGRSYRFRFGEPVVLTPPVSATPR